MNPAYYDRKQTRHIDGSLLFKSPEDVRNEKEVAGILQGAWECVMHPYAELSPVDWWIERDNRVVGFTELKCRSHETTTYKTVFLSHRKYIALRIAQQSGPKAVFVARFTDGIRWIMINNVDPSRLTIAGCRERKWKESDIEPVIEVPIADMKAIRPV